MQKPKNFIKILNIRGRTWTRDSAAPGLISTHHPKYTHFVNDKKIGPDQNSVS
jgi:hypothetical protein